MKGMIAMVMVAGLTLGGCATVPLGTQQDVSEVASAAASGKPVAKTTVLSTVNTICTYAAPVAQQVQLLIAEHTFNPTSKVATAIKYSNAALASMNQICSGGAGPTNSIALLIRLWNAYLAAKSAVEAAR